MPCKSMLRYFGKGSQKEISQKAASCHDAFMVGWIEPYFNATEWKSKDICSVTHLVPLFASTPVLSSPRFCP